MAIPLRPLVDRFWLKVKKSDDGCWVWIGTRNDRGYGIITQGGKGTPDLRAHRLSWEIANGRSIPAGMNVLHRCDNPPCVRPDHLFVGDQRANVDDMIAKGRHSRGVGHSARCVTGDDHWTRLDPERCRALAKRGEQVGNAKLTADVVVRIRRLLIDGKQQKQIAAELGVSKSLISLVALRKIWRHVA